MNVEERLREMGEHKPAELPSQHEWEGFRARGHGRLLRRRVGVALAAAVIVVAGAQGASSLLQQQAAPLPPAGEDTPGVIEWSPGLIAMQTWYAQGDLLYLDHQLIPTPMVSATERKPADRQALMQATLERVLEGPTDSSAGTVLPEGTRLIDSDLGPLTTVDLSGFSDGLSAKERRLALAQIVATALQFEEVESVTVLEDGFSLTDAPLTEVSFDELLPPIVITQPASAEYPESYTGSLTFEGTANVFEATVGYELVGEEGNVITDGFTTATCGSGCRGELSQRVKFEVAEPTFASLNVYSSSAEDGSRMFEVSVPVYLCPTGSEIGDDPQAICGQS
ncbi:MAG: GerMN domain-containing protein [Actinomycetota bacterium]|nr:GerMN domain-containing protein [Actinomycetota bacterium]